MNSSSSFLKGCLSCFSVAIGLLFLSFLGSLGGGSFALPVVLLTAIVVVIVVVNRRNKDSRSMIGDFPAPSPMQATPTMDVASGIPATSAPAETIGYGTTICDHVFSEQQLLASETVKCPCGYAFQSADLLEHQKLYEKIIKAQAKLRELKIKIRSEAESSRQTLAMTTTASQTKAVAKPAEPKVEKPKVSLSLQQWLIIGASLLVMVAGAVFVSTSVNTLPQWAFEIITITVAVATGFGAFRTHRISVILSNFLAAFSSSMQLATMSIIGDQISPDFTWSTMPAWYWCVSLAVVSGLATLLARFSKNFGWKAIAVLASATTALVLALGIVRVAIDPSAFGLQFALLSATAVLTLIQAKYLRGIPQHAIEDPAGKDYFLELAKREDASMRIVAQVLAGLQLLVAIGLAIIAIAVAPLDAPQSLPILLVAVVWLPVALFWKTWSEQLTPTGQPSALAMDTSRGVVYVSLGLAAISAATSLPNPWLAATASIVSVLALLLVSVRIPALKPSVNVVTVGLWTSLASWLLWSDFDLAELSNNPATGVVLVCFALALSASDLTLRINRYEKFAPVVSVLGLALLALNLRQELSPETAPVLFAVLALLIAVSSNLQLVAGQFITKRLGLETRSRWISFAGSIFVILLLVVPNQSDTEGIARVLSLGFAFMVYSILAQAIEIWTPLKKQFGKFLTAQNYLGQSVTLVGIYSSLNLLDSVQASTSALLILCLGLINYAFGFLQKSTLKLQLGLGGLLVALLLQEWSTKGGSLPLRFAIEILVVAALAWLQAWAMSSRTKAQAEVVSFTPVVATGTMLLLSAVTLGSMWLTATSIDVFAVLAILAAVSIIAIGLASFTRIVRSTTLKFSLSWVAFTYAAFSVLLNFSLRPVESFEVAHLRLIAASVLFGLVIWLQNRKNENRGLMVLLYLANISTAALAADLTRKLLDTGDATEPYSVWISAAIVGSTLMVGKSFGPLRRALLVDVPILGTAATSLVHALVAANDSDLNIWRGILSLAAIATHCYLRSRTAAPIAWLSIGYLAGAGSATWLAHGLTKWLQLDFNGPEVFSVLVALSILIGNAVLVRRIKIDLTDLRYGLLVAVLALPSLIFALANGFDLFENQLREVLSLAVIAALAYWRIQNSKPLPWIVTAYISATGSMVALGGLISKNWLTSFEGPEIYAALVCVAILGIHRVALPHLKFKSTWFSWGLPISVVLLPSILFTYASLNEGFEQLSVGQVSRLLLTLLASIGLLIFGVRLGNLANATMGIAGLALVVLPNTAMHSGSVVPDSQVETTSLVAGILLFGFLALLGKYGKVHGNSLLFIGIPVVIALSPALVKSLIALGSPSLSAVDWWRFGLVLAAALTLLIVGTLREVAGMFYPGLLSVLMSALPYGFRQNEPGAWFLWVLLLLVAGVMVWLSVRLERMRKAGRNSTSWLKELK